MMEHCDPVVSAKWLSDHLRDPDVKVLDASFYLPMEQRDPFDEYKATHIPGALFFDIDHISDQTSNLPHMLPSEDAFAAAVSTLGIYNKDSVVVYDGKGLFSAARAWWMFRAFGHDKVWVLDGGLPRWCASGLKVESCLSGNAVSKVVAASEAVKNVYGGQPVPTPTFKAKFRADYVWTIEQVKQNMHASSHQHIDARSKERFNGVAPEPREGISSGHIPGSKCIPFPQMFDSYQMLLSEDELREKIFLEGISWDHLIATSCGTGVTACILNLALFRIGKRDVPVYDGSWTEWATMTDTPKVNAR